MVLGKQEEAAYVLELGADSFVLYPPDAKELKARINALIRRRQNDNTSGGGQNNGYGGNSHPEPPDLTPTERRITSYLQMNKGQVIDYEDIIQWVWNGQNITVDALQYHIRKLKMKLSGLAISHLRGVGYLIV